MYHNQRLFIVPAPGKVTVDGDLGDWDLSGEILTYVVEASMAYQSAKTAMMYDREALYISSRVADPTPLLNKADPAVNPDFGWDGDAFQFRLCLDPGLGYPLKIGGYDRTPSEMLVHMTLWYFTDKQLPVLHLKYGMDFHDAHGYHKGVVPADKFQAAYVPWADGKGFTFEYRIPWSTLAAPRPLRGGDMTAAAIQSPVERRDRLALLRRRLGGRPDGPRGVHLPVHALVGQGDLRRERPPAEGTDPGRRAAGAEDAADVRVLAAEGADRVHHVDQ